MSFSFTETKASTAREFYAQGAVAHDGLSALKIEGSLPLRAGGFGATIFPVLLLLRDFQQHLFFLPSNMLPS